MTNQRDGGGQLALVAAAVRARLTVGVLGQGQLVQRPLHNLKVTDDKVIKLNKNCLL